MGPRRGDLTALIEHALAPKTARRYASYANRVLDVTGLQSFMDHEESQRAIERFIQWAYTQKKTKSSAQAHLTAVAHYSKLTTGRDPANSHYIKSAIKRWRRLEGPARDQWRPIEFSPLRQLLGALRHICHENFEYTLFKAAFSLAFFGAFRVSELVAPAKSGPTDTCIHRQDVQIGKRNMQILLQKSKTDQLGKGEKIELKCLDDHELCPVCSTREFIQLSPEGQGTLLKHENGDSLSIFQFKAVLRRALTSMGLPANKFGTHSVN
ncbi:integrase/recombinase xerD homolog [Pleurodeles waltl]|uniref:integrase/recombinase xerD homolog n=1 Tax=Pleurodeles waltl TaxID=8319 RepID=UPI0037099430